MKYCVEMKTTEKINEGMPMHDRTKAKKPNKGEAESGQRKIPGKTSGMKTNDTKGEAKPNESTRSSANANATLRESSKRHSAAAL